MEGLPIASTSLRWLAGVTILFQIGLLLGVPIPSPVSSRRVWAHRRGEPSSGDHGPVDPFAARLLPIFALAGLPAVMAAVIWPGGAGGLLLPAGARFPSALIPAAGSCLLAGNGLIAMAVWTLKRHTGFDEEGQSRQLVAVGIFRFMRHPIAGGMGLIYLGFFLALPSPLVLVGLGCYAWHQERRLAAEEVLLAKRFGPSYHDYRCRVGRFGPRRLSRER